MKRRAPVDCSSSGTEERSTAKVRVPWREQPAEEEADLTASRWAALKDFRIPKRSADAPASGSDQSLSLLIGHDVPSTEYRPEAVGIHSEASPVAEEPEAAPAPEVEPIGVVSHEMVVKYLRQVEMHRLSSSLDLPMPERLMDNAAGSLSPASSQSSWSTASGAQDSDQDSGIGKYKQKWIPEYFTEEYLARQMALQQPQPSHESSKPVFWGQTYQAPLNQNPPPYDVHYANAPSDSHEPRRHDNREKWPPRILCKHFKAGFCSYGADCTFLHPGINGPMN